MPSLAEITPLVVTVSGVPVRGISGEGIGQMIARFPVVQKMLTERKISPPELVKVAPEAAAAFIAAGIGKPGDAKEEAMARELAVGLQIEFLAAVFKVSFPNGLSAAVEAMQEIAKALPGADVPDTTEQASN